MFDFLKKKKPEIAAPISGKVLKMEACSDPVFSSKALGDGVVIMPTSGEVYSPVDGSVALVADTIHAISIVGEDDLELLIHLGIDTVNLKGEGFKCNVKVGDKVKKGDLIAVMDIDFIKKQGYKLDTPCILLNQDTLTDVEFITGGEAIGGQTTVMSYKKI